MNRQPDTHILSNYKLLEAILCSGSDRQVGVSLMLGICLFLFVFKGFASFIFDRIILGMRNASRKQMWSAGWAGAALVISFGAIYHAPKPLCVYFSKAQGQQSYPQSPLTSHDKRHLWVGVTLRWSWRWVLWYSELSTACDTRILYLSIGSCPHWCTSYPVPCSYAAEKMAQMAQVLGPLPCERHG